MGIKISEMTPDASVTGVELLPVSDAGSAKSVTTAGLKNYVVDQIEAIEAGTAVTGADGVFILQDGVLKPVDIDLVAQHAIDTVWGKAAEASPDDADVMALKDGGTTEKTVTLAVLAAYVQTAIRAAVLNPATLDAAGATAGADLMVIGQGGVAKKITLTEVNASIFAALLAYVTGLSAATTTNDSDEIYVIQGSTAKKMTLAMLVSHFTGSSPVTGTGTTDAIARWASSSTLKGDITFSTTLQTGTDTNIASSKAVRDAMSKLIYDQTESQADLEDEDYLMIDDGGAGTAQRKVAMPLVWEYINAMNAAGEGIKTIVSDQVIALGAVAGVAVLTIPAGSHILSIQSNVQVLAVAGGTSVKIGLGVDADPDAYGLTASLLKNVKTDAFMENYDLMGTDPASTVRGNSVEWTREAVALEAYPCATDGSIGDTAFTAGTLRVRVVYQVCNSLDDAE